LLGDFHLYRRLEQRGVKFPLILRRHAQKFTDYGDRERIGERFDEIDLAASLHTGDEIIDDGAYPSFRPLHPFRGELKHNMPAQAVVFRRITGNQGAMLVGDMRFDRIENLILDEIAGSWELGLRHNVRTRFRVKKQSANFFVGADDVEAIVSADHGFRAAAHRAGRDWRDWRYPSCPLNTIRPPGPFRGLSHF
jgi:hypothetical protein